MASDGFDLLNDLMDSWALQKLMVPYTQEVIHEITAGQYVYTIGPGGMVGASIGGSISGTTLTVSSIASGALSVGMLIVGAGVTAGTMITALGTGLGGNTVTALGTYFVNFSQTVGNSALTATAVRPVRIRSAFVRVITSGGLLDYWVDVQHVENYEQIGMKALNGPWPKKLYYQPSMPVGVLNYWPNPSQGEMHLFCDSILTRFQTQNDTIALPPGYEIAMRWGLAELIMPEYPVAAGASAELRALIPKYAKDSRDFIKRANMVPQQTASFDPILNAASNRNDAGWIFHGGQN